MMTSCSTTLEKNADGSYDKGAFYDIYLGKELYSFDPSLNYINSEMSQIYSLLYEGLTRLDKNGKWQKAMMDSYTITTDKMNGDMLIDITLKNTAWSDGRTVQAADFMYAWKYVVLDPNHQSEAASMLFEIKNAQQAKLGNMSMDDVGITCPSTYVLEIRIDKENASTFDIDRFFTHTASIALLPLREDIVAKGDFWSKKMTSIVTNGPFAIKELSFGGIFRIDRNQYYLLSRDKDSNEMLDKYVVPYRIISHYDIGTLEEQMKAYEEGLICYLGDIPLNKRAEYASKATIIDEMNTLSVLFNLNHPVLGDQRVRQALSLAIDRNALAEKVVYADPATGLIGSGVYNEKAGTSFRSASGSLLSTSANLQEAKSLLSQASSAGVLTPGEITLTIRGKATIGENSNEDLAVANLLAEAWNSLLADYGITVKIRFLNTSNVVIAGQTQLYYNDDFQNAYESGDFEIILIDVAMLSSDPFATLAPYATNFSGNGCDMDSETYDVFGHISGYASEEYESLIEKAHAETGAKKRAEILHEAEALLMKDLPVVPLLFTKNACLYNDSVLSKIETTYAGTFDLKQMTMKNYMTAKEGYDDQFLQVYSSVISHMIAINEFHKPTGTSAYWSPYISTKDFSLYMTMDEIAAYISSIKSTQTTKREVLPLIKYLINENYGVNVDSLTGESTLHDLTQ
ncbi:MAG: hypothetical protein II797_04400, partial [Clostridia bacterium]|nr:hypothetical protein [Clostridia bacterium]